MNIPVGIEGRVLNSEHPGHVLRVEDDGANTGGFLIFHRWTESNGPNANGEFDDWVENVPSLHVYFTESKWQIEWDKQ